jgi:hypothetical protein
MERNIQSYLVEAFNIQPIKQGGTEINFERKIRLNQSIWNLSGT